MPMCPRRWSDSPEVLIRTRASPWVPHPLLAGHSVSCTSYRLPAHQLAELLQQAAFTVPAQLVQELDKGLKRTFGSFPACEPIAEEPA